MCLLSKDLFSARLAMSNVTELAKYQIGRMVTPTFSSILARVGGIKLCLVFVVLRVLSQESYSGSQIGKKSSGSEIKIDSRIIGKRKEKRLLFRLCSSVADMI